MVEKIWWKDAVQIFNGYLTPLAQEGPKSRAEDINKVKCKGTVEIRFNYQGIYLFEYTMKNPHIEYGWHENMFLFFMEELHLRVLGGSNKFFKWHVRKQDILEINKHHLRWNAKINGQNGELMIIFKR